jgi:hypothetical protein
MSSNYDDIDLRFSWNGDFLLENGDLQSNENNTLLSTLDQIHDICASISGDWSIYPNRAANLDNHLGETNTKERAARIRRDIILALVSANIVAEEDLTIHVIPVHSNKVLIVIRIDAVATPYNKLTIGEPLQTSLVYDSFEQQIFFLDKTPQLMLPGV